MRTLKITLMAAMALALGATTASASSVDVIWLGSGTATTTVAANTSVTGNIVMTIGASDTALGGFGAGYELSGSYAGISVTGNTNVPPSGGAALATGPDDLAGLFENIVAAAYFGPAVAAGTSAILGTVTVNSGAGGGSITVGPFGAFGDDILNPGPTSILSEFSFGAGNVVVVPEPTTASLLGLGLMGLTVAGRRRKS